MNLNELKLEIEKVESLQYDIADIKDVLDRDNMNNYKGVEHRYIDIDILKEAYRETYKIILKEKETELEIKMKKIKEKVLL